MLDSDPLQSLLDQLCRGDPEAAHRAFLACEPYLRLVVRRRLHGALRAKFDSTDIVQSVWADLVGGFRAGVWQFQTVAELRSFLIKVTRNRLIDRVRRERAAMRQLGRLDTAQLQAVPQLGDPGASAALEAEELWQRMLDLCPPQHRELLVLKRQGLPLAEIAARTGLHEGSVRRVLYDLAARLAEQGPSAPAGARRAPAD